MGIKSTLSLKAITTDTKDQKKGSDKEPVKNAKSGKNETTAAVHIGQINEPEGFKLKDKTQNKVGLVHPPKEINKEKTPLIVEHRDEQHDLKTYYNPDIKPNPHEYTTEVKKVE